MDTSARASELLEFLTQRTIWAKLWLCCDASHEPNQHSFPVQLYSTIHLHSVLLKQTQSCAATAGSWGLDSHWPQAQQCIYGILGLQSILCNDVVVVLFFSLGLIFIALASRRIGYWITFHSLKLQWSGGGGSVTTASTAQQEHKQSDDHTGGKQTSHFDHII